MEADTTRAASRPNLDALREVVENQAALGHKMTIVPNDVLVALLGEVAALRADQPNDDEITCPSCHARFDPAHFTHYRDD